jgi:hypothetical protein
MFVKQGAVEEVLRKDVHCRGFFTALIVIKTYKKNFEELCTVHIYL